MAITTKLHFGMRVLIINLKSKLILFQGKYSQLPFCISIPYTPSMRSLTAANGCEIPRALCLCVSGYPCVEYESTNWVGYFIQTPAINTSSSGGVAGDRNMLGYTNLHSASISSEPKKRAHPW